MTIADCITMDEKPRSPPPSPAAVIDSQISERARRIIKGEAKSTDHGELHELVEKRVALYTDGNKLRVERLRASRRRARAARVGILSLIARAAQTDDDENRADAR